MTIAVVKSGSFTGVTYGDLELSKSIYDDHTAQGETLVYLESSLSNSGTDAVPVYRSPTAGETASTIGTGDLPSTFSVDEDTKLAGVEDNATADQDAAEVRALVAAATDSNVFTDAEQSKLSNIEDNATADQTASEIESLYEGQADTNKFTDAEQAKLSHISVTQAVDLDTIESDLAGKQDELTAGDHITITSGSSTNITVTSNDGPVFDGQLLGTSSGSSWGRIDINNFPNIRFSESFVVGQTYRFIDNALDVWEFELGSIIAGGLTQSYIQLIPATEPIVNPDGAATTGHLQDFSDISILWSGSGNIVKVTGGGANEVSVDTADFVMATEKGANNGVAPLNSSGKIDNSYLSTDVMNYKGSYDASTNSPDLTSSYSGSEGDTYIVNVAGTQDLDGSIGSTDFIPGDLVVWNGSGFEHVPSDTNLDAAGVKTLYEQNADTNALTDALLAKLNGVEAGAEVNPTGAEIVGLYEGESDRNAFTDAEKAKLANLSNNPAGDYQRIVANPTITSATTIPTLTSGGTVSYQVQSSDPQSLFKIIDDDGTGITINAETGTMFGGSGAAAGSYTLVVVTASVFGVSAETNLSLTIS